MSILRVPAVAVALHGNAFVAPKRFFVPIAISYIDAVVPSWVPPESSRIMVLVLRTSDVSLNTATTLA